MEENSKVAVNVVPLQVYCDFTSVNGNFADS